MSSKVNIETERMKIEIAAGYITTAYNNMIVVLLTILVTVFTALLAVFLAGQIPFLAFALPVIIVEIIILFGVVDQARRFYRRVRYLDTLIANLDVVPAVRLPTLSEILNQIRSQ